MLVEGRRDAEGVKTDLEVVHVVIVVQDVPSVPTALEAVPLLVVPIGASLPDGIVPRNPSTRPDIMLLIWSAAMTEPSAGAKDRLGTAPCVGTIDSTPGTATPVMRGDAPDTFVRLSLPGGFDPELGVAMNGSLVTGVGVPVTENKG